MPEFSFAEEGHKYLLEDDNRVIHTLPSVTSVLPYNYHGDNTDAMIKGSYVHQMIDLEAKGTLDEETLHPDLKPYLEAYRRFRTEHELNGIYDFKSGSPHPCTELQLAGYHLLVEVSTLLPDVPHIEVKLYSGLYRFAGTIDIVKISKMPCNAYAVYLQDTGRYKMVDHTKDLRRNKAIFLSFLTAYKWRSEKGLL